MTNEQIAPKEPRRHLLTDAERATITGLDPDFGGWTSIAATSRTSVYHYFQNPFSSSACSKYGPRRKGPMWVGSVYPERRRCSMCTKKLAEWEETR